MTTQTSAVTSAAPATDGPRGIPFRRLLHVETRKLVDTRSGRWMLVAIALLVMLVAGVQLWVADRGSSSFDSLVDSTTMPQMLLLPVFGILAMTSEFSQRTAMTTFALEPRRARVVAAKVGAALLLALALLLVGLLAAAVLHLGAVVLKDEPAAWGLAWTGVAGLVGGQVLSVLQGLAFGLLLRSPALAIVVYFALPTVFTIATGLVSALSGVRPWLDFGLANLAVYEAAMSGQAWAHLATSAALWLGVPFAVGTWLLCRREIA